MKYESINANPGDSIQINEIMSLRYDEIASDIGPVWHEVPSEKANLIPHEGNFISVTDDVWFVFDHGQWRVMTPAEQVEASRQDYLAHIKIPDRSEPRVLR